MSRSYRIPIVKTKAKNSTPFYWRIIRSGINQIVRGYITRYDNTITDLYYGEDCDYLEIRIVEENSTMLGTDIPNLKTIINDVNYCEDHWDFRFLDRDDCKIKYTRK